MRRPLVCMSWILLSFVPCSLLFLVSGLVLESVGPSGGSCYRALSPFLRDFGRLGDSGPFG